MAQFIPSIVMVNIRINGRRAQQLESRGITAHRRSIEDELALNARIVREAEAIGRDPWRGNRTDAAGISRPDSGTPIFGWGREGRPMATLSHVADDLEALGLTPYHANIIRKPGDRNDMASVRIWFAHGREVIGEIAAAADLLDDMLNATYEHTHGFRNPNQTMTIDSSHRVDGRPKLRVRIRPDWAVNCEEV